MASVAALITWIALAGALVSFVLGVAWSAQATRGQATPRQGAPRWLAVVAWPFAIGRIRAEGGQSATQVNKALVAFLACMLIGVAAFSASTNLHRFAK